MPRIAETPCGNAQRHRPAKLTGVDVFLDEKLPRLPWRETPIVGQPLCLRRRCVRRTGRRCWPGPRGVAALEVNISCPNVKAGGIAFGQDPSMAGKLTEAVKRRAGNKPVWVKLSPNVTDLVAIARAAVLGGADALTCINTLTGLSRRHSHPQAAPGQCVSAACPDRPSSPWPLRCVWQVCRAVSVPVIGVGGISSAEDVAGIYPVRRPRGPDRHGQFHASGHGLPHSRRLPGLMAELGIESLDAYRGSLVLPGN